ncbi:MAG: hypothetical protein JXB04_10945 [Kiritimatiellae bacterium]|nr:hypothetical protein [Kiritimatiellia bacterium]
MASSQHRKAARDELVEMEFLEALHRRRPQDVNILRALADLYTKVGRIEEGLKADLELVKLCPGECEAWYNLACSYALAGDRDRAFDVLSRAVDLGYRDQQWLIEDGDLDSLRHDPRFTRLLYRIALGVPKGVDEDKP